MNEISICFLFFCFVFILLCKLSVLLKLEVTRILLCKSNYFLCSKCWECFDDFDFCLLLSTRSSIAINCKIYLYIYTTTPYESVHHFISDTDCLQSMFVGRCRRWRVVNDLSMRWDSPLELMNRGQSHFWMIRKKQQKMWIEYRQMWREWLNLRFWHSSERLRLYAVYMVAVVAHQTSHTCFLQFDQLTYVNRITRKNLIKLIIFINFAFFANFQLTSWEADFLIATFKEESIADTCPIELFG